MKIKRSQTYRQLNIVLETELEEDCLLSLLDRGVGNSSSFKADLTLTRFYNELCREINKKEERETEEVGHTDD